MFRSTDPDQGVKYQPNCKQKYFTLKTQSELLKKKRDYQKNSFSLDGFCIQITKKKKKNNLKILLPLKIQGYPQGMRLQRRPKFDDLKLN